MITKHTTKHRHISCRTSGNKSNGHGATAAHVAEEDLFCATKGAFIAHIVCGCQVGAEQHDGGIQHDEPVLRPVLCHLQPVHLTYHVNDCHHVLPVCA